MSGGRAHGHHRAEWVDYLRVWPLSIRPFSLEVVGDIERGWLIPVDPAEGAVSLFMPDFEVSFEEGLGLGLGSLLVQQARAMPCNRKRDRDGARQRFDFTNGRVVFAV